MSEQLYRIERRPAKAGEVVAHWTFSTGSADADVLVPVPEVFDLGWACGEMVRNPGKVYLRAGSEWCYRYSRGEGFEYRAEDDEDGAWREGVFDSDDETATDWMPLFTAPAAVPAAAPAPGTLAWAKATVAAGGAVWWNGYPCEKYDAYGLLLPGGRRSRDTYMLIAASGWHPWGDREWLAALPDGTRVRHEMHGIWVKCDGWWLIRTVGGVQTSLSIKHAADSGWDLDREPAPRDLASQLAELERRVAALEGKA